jgi:hypothetical protein
LASKIRRYTRGTSVESSVSEEPTQIWRIWAGCSARPSSVYGRFDDLYNLVPDRFLLVVWDRVRKHARSARTAIVGASDGYEQTQDPRGLRKIPSGHPCRTGYNHHPEMNTEERYASKGPVPFGKADGKGPEPRAPRQRPTSLGERLTRPLTKTWRCKARRGSWRDGAAGQGSTGRGSDLVSPIPCADRGVRRP